MNEKVTRYHNYYSFGIDSGASGKLLSQLKSQRWLLLAIGTWRACHRISMVNDLGVMVYLAALRIAMHVSTLNRWDDIHLRCPGCWACWCPCLLYSRNRRRLDHLNIQGYPDPRRDENVISADSWLYAAVKVVCPKGLALSGEHFYFTPHAFPSTSNRTISPTDWSDEHFFRRLTPERIFVNGMASEAAILVTLVRHAVAQDVI